MLYFCFMWTNLFKLLVDGHYWIASAALASFWQTYFLLLQEKIKPTSTNIVLSGLIFFMTLGIYNLHSVIGILFLKKIPKNFSTRFQLIENYPAFFYFNLIFSSLGTFFCLFFVDWHTLYALVPALALGMLYIFPILGKWRLRDLPLLKIFLVAFVWAWVTVYFPFALDLLSYKNLLFPFLERFLFIFAITLPFDIRDIEIDALEKVETITQRLGKSRTIYLSSLLLCTWGILSALYYDNIILALGGLICAFLVYRLKYISIKDTYFSIILDGSILILAIVIVLQSYCSIIYK